MAKSNFYLRDPKSSGPTMILLSVRWDGKRCYLSTGQKVTPKYWNDKEQRVKRVKGFPNHYEVNEELDHQLTQVIEIFNKHKSEVQEYERLMAKVNSLDSDLKVNRTPPKKMTPERFKSLLKDRRANPLNNESTDTDLFDFINDFIVRKEQARKPRTGERYSPKTIYKFKELRDSLKEFNPLLSFTDLDETFYEQYLSFMEGKGTNSKGVHRSEGPLSLNTIGKYIKVFRSVLNDAESKGVRFSPIWRSTFSSMSEDSSSTYLTESEIGRLYELDLSNKPHLERVRDLFVVGCWTGFRYSDLHQLNEQVITGNFIKIKTKKTRDIIVVPIHRMTKLVLDKYNYQLPPAISNQKFNEYLKEVSKLAGFVETFEKRITIGGELRIEKKKRYEVITSHTARRSFATNLYKAGFPVISIMKITGHTTEKSFLAYIKVTPQEHADLLMKFWDKQKELWDQETSISRN